MAKLSLRRLLIKNTGVQMVAHVVFLAVGLATSSFLKGVMLFRGINRELVRMRKRVILSAKATAAHSDPGHGEVNPWILQCFELAWA